MSDAVCDECGCGCTRLGRVEYRSVCLPQGGAAHIDHMAMIVCQDGHGGRGHARSLEDTHDIWWADDLVEG